MKEVSSFQSPFLLKFVDNEGDQVALDSKYVLDLAIQEALASSTKCLRVALVPTEPGMGYPDSDSEDVASKKKSVSPIPELPSCEPACCERTVNVGGLVASLPNEPCAAPSSLTSSISSGKCFNLMFIFVCMTFSYASGARHCRRRLPWRAWAH